LTADILKGKKIKVDEKGFAKEMEDRKKLARAQWKGSGDKLLDDRWFKISEELILLNF
jgi:alanyl-tRNA synthetase